ncbi:MAG TPA: alpha/beta hydrolase [Gemmatimonadaceae bacterium]|nr:alpha/beta hydrolase [Gemmatimonadaceae bacterium]
MSRERFLAFRRSLGRTPPLSRQRVRARGLDFAVYSSPPVEGAPPLLCVNGGLLFDHRLLWPALSPLAAKRQVVLYDQRGRGQSQPPPDVEAARIEDDAEDVGAIRRALGVRRWDVLGHSWGGGIALLAVARDLAGTRRLITVDAVGPTSGWLPALRAAVEARGSDDDRAVLARATDEALSRPDLALHADHAAAVYRAWFADPTLAEHITPPRGQSVTGATIAARIRREGYDWRPVLRALSRPTLVMHGERDAVPVSVAHELSALLPRARLALVPEAGHMPFWEAPETFFALVESFLAATDPA